MNKILKLSLTGMVVLYALSFTACQQSSDPEIKYVDKIVEKEVLTEVPTDMTSHAVVAVYHWKQSKDGLYYEKVTYEENENGTVKKDESGNSIAIEKTLSVAAGTKLSSIAKSFYGFSPKGLVESLNTEGTYAVHVYYDRNLVTVTVTADGLSASTSGLYDTNIDLSPVLAEVPKGKFITPVNIPEVYPAENKTYTVTLDNPNSASLDGFIKVEHGSFKCSTANLTTRVTEENTHTITITKDFYVCDHEVTQGEWERYMTYYGAAASGSYTGQISSSEPYVPVDKYGKGENYPAYYINWYEAVIYCNLLSKEKGLEPCYYVTLPKIDGDGNITSETENIYDPEVWSSSDRKMNAEKTCAELFHVAKNTAGKFYYNSTVELETTDVPNVLCCDFTKNGYRLPTAAEWELSALGSFSSNPNWNGYGDSSDVNNYIFAGYDGTNAGCYGSYMWYDENSKLTSHQVKGKLPNSYGLYDMSGNVNELCYDWTYGNDFITQDETDPKGLDTGSNHALYSGYWHQTYSGNRVCYRSSAAPAARSKYNGVRLVRNATE